VSALSDIKVIDTDTHVIEPADLWTSRVSVKKWGNAVPYVRWDDQAQEEAWFFGDRKVVGAAHAAFGMWKEHPPYYAARLSDVDPANLEVGPRVALMDRYGIWAQVLYPNVAGFGAGRYIEMRDPELQIACVRAYNDFLSEFAAEAPGRFIPVAGLPIWDVDLCVQEAERAAANGHKGIVCSSQPETWGQPHLVDRYWDKLWAAAQDAGLSINFHIASGDWSSDSAKTNGNDPFTGRQANFAANGVILFLGNALAISRIITSGICHRFPRLKFVSVESGVGWIPYALKTLDWQWVNCGVRKEHPEYDLMPSEYFKRQIYGCFWFEHETFEHALDVLGPDNLLYETDFPHPVSMTPGPASGAVPPNEYIEKVFGSLPIEVARKILHDNAAMIYHVD
jgi:predicted TIM-barrel fold metal-dependent hydrolase